jgi:hypothetical protein
MAEIGTSTRERSRIDERSFDAIDDAAIKAPLSAEPFLVHGVRAQLSGDLQGAKHAFVAAQWRDPRSLAAAYFLANQYLRRGDAYRGLEQTSLLARLSPGGTTAAAPFVAGYAKDRSNWPKIRALFRSQPGMADEVLRELARDPDNADAIMAIADSRHRRAESAWFPTLLDSLINAGQYSRAHAIWSTVADVSAEPALVYDPEFRSPEPPPPFNWSLTSSVVGSAERQPGNRLHLIFYGNRDGVLARELVMLPAGKYRLRVQLGGGAVHPELLFWSVRCAGSDQPVSRAPIRQAADVGWTFLIPEECPAQWLELSGQSGDIAQQADVTLTALKLEPADADA